MTHLRDWLLWNPRRALLAGTAALVLAFAAITGLGYASQVHRYHLAVAAAEEQAAAKAAGTGRAWYENTPSASPSDTPGDASTMAPTGAAPTGGPTAAAGFTEDLTEHAEEEDPAATQADVAAARSTAAAFVTGWLAGAGGTDAVLWSVPLAPLVTPEVASTLPLTALDAIPAATLVETTVASSSIADVVIRAALSDGTSLDVTVLATTQGWLVSDYVPAAS